MPLLENILSESEVNKIIELYTKENYSLRAIQREYGYNRFSVSRMLTRLGYKTTKGNHYRYHFFDFDYFEKIDEPNKAYWLGFLYADGYISDKPKYGQQKFRLSLQERDKQTIIDFKTDLHSNYPIGIDNDKRKNHQNKVYLDGISQKTVDDLKRLGCIERKSLILEFPTKEQVPRTFIYDFIRGYFDGDGSISYCKSKNKYDSWTVSFVGTESFIKELSTYFDGGSVLPDKRKTNSWYYNIGGNLKIISFYHKIYDGAERYMKRKYDKFQPLLKKYSEN